MTLLQDAIAEVDADADSIWKTESRYTQLQALPKAGMTNPLTAPFYQ
jgi:hypothetical protein